MRRRRLHSALRFVAAVVFVASLGFMLAHAHADNLSSASNQNITRSGGPILGLLRWWSNPASIPVALDVQPGQKICFDAPKDSLCVQCNDGGCSGLPQLASGFATTQDTWFWSDSPAGSGPQGVCWHGPINEAAGWNALGCWASITSVGLNAVTAITPDGRRANGETIGAASNPYQGDNSVSNGEVAIENGPKWDAVLQAILADGGWTNLGNGGLRIWCGWSNGALYQHDSNSNINFAAFRCSTSANGGSPDTNWQACMGAVTQTCTATSVACPSANGQWFDLGIDCNAKTSCDFWINGAKQTTMNNTGTNFPQSDAGDFGIECVASSPLLDAGAPITGIYLARIGVRQQ